MGVGSYSRERSALITTLNVTAQDKFCFKYIHYSKTNLLSETLKPIKNDFLSLSKTVLT